MLPARAGQALRGLGKPMTRINLVPGAQRGMVDRSQAQTHGFALHDRGQASNGRSVRRGAALLC